MDTMAAFAMGEANRGRPMMVFDWDKAAQIIRDRRPECAEAGLEGDWGYTGGTIYSSGQPDMESYTYLASTWATPLLRLDDDEVPCYRMESEAPGWDSGTKWPDSALAILNGTEAVPKSE